MSEELKPCPFCGGEVEVIKRCSEKPYIHGVLCKGCRCRTSFEKSEKEAVQKWNTRKSLEKIEEQIRCEGASISHSHWDDDELHNAGKVAQEVAVKAIEIVRKGGAE